MTHKFQYSMKTFSFSFPVKAVLAFSVLLTACSSKEEQQTTTPTTETAKVAITTSPIQHINPSYTISVPGEMKPYEQVALYSKVSGFIKTLYVDRGDQVKKGQLLALLEAPEVNQRHLSDKSAEQKVHTDYLLAKQVYERLVDASKTNGAVALIELERAKSNMNSAKAAYESAKASTAQAYQQQDYLRITAPFDGIITDRYLSTGSLVGNNGAQPVFAMAQNGKLRLTVSIPEKHAAAVPDEMTATFTVSGAPGEKFDTQLSRTSGLLNNQDRSLTLEFDIDNKDKRFKGGDYAQVQLNLQRHNPTYWVNNKSILRSQAGTFVLTLDKEQNLKRIPVKMGAQLDTITEVFGQLALDDLIINKPSEEMKEGKITM